MELVTTLEAIAIAIAIAIDFAIKLGHPEKCVCTETAWLSVFLPVCLPACLLVCLSVSRYYRIAIVKAYELESSFVFLNSLQKQKQ